MSEYYLINLAIGIIVYAIADVLHDRSSSIATWRTSILKIITVDLLKMTEEKAVNSFFGSKDYTWDRKHNDNIGVFSKLKKSIFVMFTDIWHLSDTIKRIGIHYIMFSLLVVFLPFLSALLLTVFNYIVFAFIFHINYTYVLSTGKLNTYIKFGVFTVLIFLTLLLYTKLPLLMSSFSFITFKPETKEQTLLADRNMELSRKVNEYLYKDSLLNLKIDSLNNQIIDNNKFIDSLNYKLEEVELKIQNINKQNPNWKKVLLDFINN